jgi:hypothetical protein
MKPSRIFIITTTTTTTTEMVLETSVQYEQLTRVTAREDFI